MLLVDSVRMMILVVYECVCLMALWFLSETTCEAFTEDPPQKLSGRVCELLLCTIASVFDGIGDIIEQNVSASYHTTAGLLLLVSVAYMITVVVARLSSTRK